jgi:uncharacterized protein
MPTNPSPELRGLDPGIARDVAAIVAIDQHAHPMPLGVELAGDPERPIQPYDVDLPLRMRPDNPEYWNAWAGLWGYDERDWSIAHLRRLMEKKQAIIAEKGLTYNAWVLDKLKIKTMIGIAPGPNPSLPSPRFEWCAFSDWLLWPFSLQDRALTGLQKIYRGTNDQFSQRFNSNGTPSTPDAYIADVMSPALAVYKEQGACGIKFHGPYNRPLNFDFVEASDAASLYRRGLGEGALPYAEHKALQDYLFERLVTIAGEMGFVVQMHTGFGVCEGFVTQGSNPLLMERIFHAVKGTKFVLLHGGWPFVAETVALLANANVYTDFSCASLFQHTRSLSNQIRAALEWYPEKLLYGTDAYSERSIALLGGLPFLANPLGGWEEKAWLMDRTGRRALALALSGMAEDGEISGERTSELMRMVMGGGAASLYRFEAGAV